MNKTRWLIFAAVCVTLVGLLFFLKPGGPEFPGDPAKIVEGDHVYGNKGAKVVFIEYADFQCPGCGDLYQPLNAVKEKYKDKVAFVFRHLPLVNIHPNAKAAAAAAEAAGKQGKFWEMHDLLFANQSSWGAAQGNNRTSYFEGYAQQLGLNIEQFTKDMGSEEVVQRVSRDFGAIIKAGYEPSTPTIVINGEKIENSSLTEPDANGNGRFNAERISAKLDEYLKKVGETPPTTEVTKPEGGEQTVPTEGGQVPAPAE